MSTVDLQYFVIKLLRHLKLVTSNAHLKPPWWPFDIPWKNIQNDPRPVREQKKVCKYIFEIIFIFMIFYFHRNHGVYVYKKL